MALIIPAVVTEDARKYWPQFFGGLMGAPSTVTMPGSPPAQWDPRIKFFKVGEGGWFDPGSGKVPRTPDPALRRLMFPFIQDIDIEVDPTRPLALRRYPAPAPTPYFKKSLVSTDFTFETPTSIRISCLLEFGDYNDDGTGFPKIWEIGLFTDHPELVAPGPDQGLMIAYGTFVEESKDPTKQIENVVRIVF